jgi:hypothetical protein
MVVRLGSNQVKQEVGANSVSKSRSFTYDETKIKMGGPKCISAQRLKIFAKKILRRCGYDIVRLNANKEIGLPHDLTEEDKEIYKTVAPFTMTSLERVVTLIQATKYVLGNGIEGDIVECGVWRGGSMMAVAHTLLRLGDTTRKIYLYDTFTGMPEPTEKDKQFEGTLASQLLSVTPRNTGIWCCADKRDVMTNIRSTGYPDKNIWLVEGKVEETIPRTAPDSICLLLTQLKTAVKRQSMNISAS